MPDVPEQCLHTANQKLVSESLGVTIATINKVGEGMFEHYANFGKLVDTEHLEGKNSVSQQEAYRGPPTKPQV